MDRAMMGYRRVYLLFPRDDVANRSMMLYGVLIF